MRRLQLTPRVDIEVYYRADMAFYAGDHAEWQQRLPLERFRERYGSCPSIGFEMDGQPIGGIILDGIEAHLAVLPHAHGCWALLFKPALRWLFSQRSAVLGRVDVDNHKGIAFVERHGWRRLKSDARTISYLVQPGNGTRKTAYSFREP